MDNYIMLFEAIMKQAYDDAKSEDEELKAEAIEFIEDMKNWFANK